jgi:hypothetical protein
LYLRVRAFFSFSIFYKEARNTAITKLHEEQMIDAKLAARGELTSLNRGAAGDACKRQGFESIKKPLIYQGFIENGGERGIRTPDRDLGPITV